MAIKSPDKIITDHLPDLESAATLLRQGEREFNDCLIQQGNEGGVIPGLAEYAEAVQVAVDGFRHFLDDLRGRSVEN
ncbi:MAG TPA: hypothetical protein VLG37_04765 [Candidatus Saccharimonadales bacterium]|nr:hypothetical protein [Candidatus Saccharimonadales bacterium]